MYKAAIKASNLQGKKAATAICNYAIFLYRHKKDPEQAAKLFCDGIERCFYFFVLTSFRFPNHRGIQKNYRAMKKELEKAVQTRQSGSISHEENLSRESNANTAKMAGMRAKLYNDVQNAEDYHISEVENDDGSFLFSIHHISCHLEHENPEEFAIYWLFNAGSGSISDRSYESSILPLQQHLEWKFSLDQNQNSPRASVTCNDHLCFEFYLMKKIDIQSKKSNFIGSIILPIEDLLHDHIPQSHTSKSRAFQSIEEPIMSDDGEVIGQMKLQYLLQ